MSGLLSDNPALVQGLGIALLAAASTTLQKGAVLSVLTFGTTVPLALADDLMRRVPAWLRLPLYSLAAMALVQLFSSLWLVRYPLLIDSLGIYLPIVAVNSMMQQTLLDGARPGGRWEKVFRALMRCAGFCVALCLISALREVAGFGTLWDHPLKTRMRFAGILLPFSGFIVLGYACAAFRRAERGLRVALWRASLSRAPGRDR